MFLVYWFTGRVGPVLQPPSLVLRWFGINNLVQTGEKLVQEFRLCAFASRARSLFVTAGAEQLAAPLLLVVPWEAQPRSGRLLGVQRGWRATRPLQH